MDEQLATNKQEGRVPETKENSIFRSLWGKLSKVQRQLLLFVAIPTLVSFFYLGLWHSPMFESQTKFAVRSTEESLPNLSIATQLLNAGSPNSNDARIINEFLGTPDLFTQLDAELHLVEHYGDKKKDFLSRLESDPTNIEKKEYWEKVIARELDPDSGIVTFTVKAYSPEMAKAIGDAVLKKSEDLVNSMNERANKDALSLAEKEVQVAQEKLVKTQEALKKFRESHQDIDLKTTAGGLQTLVLELEAEKTKISAQLSELQSYMKPDAPAVLTLEKKIEALNKQLNLERGRLTDLKDSTSLNKSVSEFESLTLDHEFAQKQLVSALAALETARVQFLSKARYVVTIAKPELPDESTYPKVLLFTLTIALCLLFIYGLCSLIVASIREHIGF